MRGRALQGAAAAVIAALLVVFGGTTATATATASATEPVHAAPPAPAATAATPAPLIGPECRPSVVSAVLAALARNGTPVVPGQQVQYLQLTQTPDGAYRLELCVVTVPDGAA
jgi:hypothetical protein